MKLVDRRAIALTALGVTLSITGACGADPDDGAAPAALAFEAVTTSPSSPSSSPSSSSRPSSSPPSSSTSETSISAFTPETLEGMLATEGGRALLIASIEAEAGIGPEAAECLLDSTPLEILADAAAAFLAGEGEGRLFPAEQLSNLGPILDSCGVDAQSIE